MSASSHLAGRWNPLSSESRDEELETWLDEVVKHFGLAWLRGGGSNVLQQVWARRDALATCELLTLGHSLITLRDHRDWLRGNVRSAKGKDRNNSLGALFELAAIGQLSATDAALVPAKRSQAGFDCSLQSANATLHVSLKRYGQSQHEALFERSAAAVRRRVEIVARKLEGGLSIVAIAARYPTADDWRALEDFVSKLPDNALKRFASDCWAIVVNSLESDGPPPGHAAHVLQVFAPFHQNESANLQSKLDDACANLDRHGPPPTERNAGIVYVRIPPSGSINHCESWTREWFDLGRFEAVRAVLLYQPTVARNDANESMLHHAYRLVPREPERPLVDADPLLAPHVSMPIGMFGAPSENRLFAPDGKSIPVDGKYVFQRGVLFRAARRDGDTWTGDGGSPAPGILLQTVIPSEATKSRPILLHTNLPATDDLSFL